MDEHGQFKIEKGVPVWGHKGLGRNAKYPWLEMEIGDSFVIDCDEPEAPTIASAQKLGGIAGRTYQRKFATRKRGNVVRIWRTA